MDLITGTVVGDFRKKLTDLLEPLGSEALTPEKFASFLAGLKSMVNDGGLQTFAEVIKQFEHDEDVFEQGAAGRARRPGRPQRGQLGR